MIEGNFCLTGPISRKLVEYRQAARKADNVDAACSRLQLARSGRILKGIYCVQIELSRETQIRVGGLGLTWFTAGYYVYVNSALAEVDKGIICKGKRELI